MDSNNKKKCLATDDYANCVKCQKGYGICVDRSELRTH